MKIHFENTFFTKMSDRNFSGHDARELLKAGYIHNQHRVGDYLLDKSLSGKRAKVYVSASNPKKVAVIHRGTQSVTDWVKTNVPMIAGYEGGNRFKHGKKVQKAAQKKYGKENITTMGHSLGGRIAEKFGKNTHQVITFNKAAVPHTWFKNRPGNQHDIRVKYDLVSLGSRTQTGGTEKLVNNGLQGALSAHRIQNQN